MAPYLSPTATPWVNISTGETSGLKGQYIILPLQGAGGSGIDLPGAMPRAGIDWAFSPESETAMVLAALIFNSAQGMDLTFSRTTVCLSFCQSNHRFSEQATPLCLYSSSTATLHMLYSCPQKCSLIKMTDKSDCAVIMIEWAIRQRYNPSGCRTVFVAGNSDG